MNKYGNDDREELLRVDIRSLYRHEHIAPETLIKNLYRVVETDDAQADLFGSVNDLFGNALDKDELEKVSDYYRHHDGWTNRLIQGDSHLVMASLLEREGMASQVQMIYMDPPYGIKYSSNWQIRMNNRSMSESSDDDLTGEPEVIKAFRDTWELGIHSYLSYIRDRLLIAKELLTESGSCFVQISDENVHLVRNVMDEVFGSENFISVINFQKTSSQSSNYLASISDYLICYAKASDKLKFRPLLNLKKPGEKGAKQYTSVISPDFKEWRKMTPDELTGAAEIPKGWKIFRFGPTTSQGHQEVRSKDYVFEGECFRPSYGRHWSYNPEPNMEMDKLVGMNRIKKTGKGLSSILLAEDNPTTELDNNWIDTGTGSFTEDQLYVVQTSQKAIQRCMLMSTDPGDLVLDPTCGSGTTSFVAEQFGRRWLTIDTSRIALNIAKTRLMTATFPYYALYDENNADIRQGFNYKTVPHITLKSLANDEPPETEMLYDKPMIDKNKLRVSGPFTVETLQNFEPVSPAELEEEIVTGSNNFEQVIKDHLLATGVKNGRKDEQVMFSRVEILANEYIHAEGFYSNGSTTGGNASVNERASSHDATDADGTLPNGRVSARNGGEKKAYFHIGPKFGTVSKNAVNEAIKACRTKGDANWLIILGFSFESDIEGGTQTMSMGTFEVTKARIHDDLLQEGLKKKPAKSAASFVTIGEPDIVLVQSDGFSRSSEETPEGVTLNVEIRGLDIYDPIKDEVKARDVHDIAYWMVDDDYDGSNFVVKQVFFCGGDKDEFAKWKKGIDTLAKDKTRARAEKTLKIEIDDEAFDRVYGHKSHPIKIKSQSQKIAVRVISQFGEESMKILTAT